METIFLVKSLVNGKHTKTIWRVKDSENSRDSWEMILEQLDTESLISIKIKGKSLPKF